MSTSVYEPVRKLVEQLFKDQWGNTTPVAFDNSQFTQPKNSAWVNVSIRWGMSEQVSIGPATRRMERHVGVVMVQVFVPKNTGTKLIGELCDLVGSVFRMKTLSDAVAGVEVVMRTPDRSFMGDTKELRQDNVTVEFQVDALF